MNSSLVHSLERSGRFALTSRADSVIPMTLGTTAVRDSPVCTA
jgi:hypothetical protein